MDFTNSQPHAILLTNMAYSIEKNTKLGLVIVRYWGVINAVDFLNYVQELEAMAPFDENYQLLLHMQDELDIDISSKDIQRVAQRVQVFSDNAARVVITSDPLSFGLSRMFGAMSPNASNNYSIVKSAREALQIFGMPLDTKIEGLS